MTIAQFTSAPVLPLLTSALFFANLQENLFDPQKGNFSSEYDFVIVGAGTAGSVLANRLSELSGQQVLLLETGGPEKLIYDVPIGLTNLQLTAIDWAFKTKPQEHACFGLDNRQARWPRGKVLGGSSTIGFMLYERGNKFDYDQWQRDGADGWSWRDVLPYFLKSEDMTDPKALENGYHSTGGPLTVSTVAEPSPVGKALQAAGRLLGYSNDDAGGHSQSGFGPLHVTIRNGSRLSTARAFLEPILDRQNLDILTNALASKIIFDSNRRAVAVQYEQDNVTFLVRARKEIILSAGVINSAQLLMLSGIGPRKHLESLGIPVIADLPVGSNLQDQPATGLSFSIDGPAPADPFSNITSLNDYSTLRQGPLTKPGPLSAVGYLKTKFADQDKDLPDISVHVIDVSPALTTAPI